MDGRYVPGIFYVLYLWFWWLFFIPTFHSFQILFPSNWNILQEVIQSRNYARPKYHTQLANMSFDEILDLTADYFFNFAYIKRSETPPRGSMSDPGILDC